MFHLVSTSGHLFCSLLSRLWHSDDVLLQRPSPLLRAWVLFALIHLPVCPCLSPSGLRHAWHGSHLPVMGSEDLRPLRPGGNSASGSRSTTPSLRLGSNARNCAHTCRLMQHGCVGSIGRSTCGEHPEPFCPGGPTSPPFRIETPDAWPRVVLFFFLLPRPSTRRWSPGAISSPDAFHCTCVSGVSRGVAHFYFAWMCKIGRMGGVVFALWADEAGHAWYGVPPSRE